MIRSKKLDVLENLAPVKARPASIGSLLRKRAPIVDPTRNFVPCANKPLTVIGSNGNVIWHELVRSRVAS